jgi:hypothetical protein
LNGTHFSLFNAKLLAHHSLRHLSPQRYYLINLHSLNTNKLSTYNLH